MRFSGFKSLCTMFFECITTKAFNMHFIMTAASLSQYVPFYLILSKSSPPFKYSRIRCTLLSDSYTSHSLIMLSWDSLRKRLTSCNNEYWKRTIFETNGDKNLRSCVLISRVSIYRWSSKRIFNLFGSGLLHKPSQSCLCQVGYRSHSNFLGSRECMKIWRLQTIAKCHDFWHHSLTQKIPDSTTYSNSSIKWQSVYNQSNFKYFLHFRLLTRRKLS